MIMTRLFTNATSFSLVWINETVRVAQQKLKIFYLEMVLGMPGYIRKWKMKWNS